jgi:hypothetical protein
MNNSNDTIGNRTRNLLTCSAVSQPTAPPRTLLKRKVSKMRKNEQQKSFNGMVLKDSHSR